MILGVYHFHNPGADLIKTEYPDHLSEKKQQEIAEVLDLLAKFKPTKIVVEATPENTAINDQYQQYLKGEFALTSNEIYQLGFRLAERLGHKKLYLGDNKMGMDMNAVIAAAQQNNNTQFLAEMQKTIVEITEMQRRHAQISVREALYELNAPQLQEKTKRLYLQMNRVRSKDNFVGADVLAGWYQRNFRILTNIYNSIESPQDRVLVIFGQGHAPYLREGIQADPYLELIEPNDFLRKVSAVGK
ncbi:MAG: hypothetical protein KF736_09245 [Acidobacteria bacterium]|nr:hypothetical protein [Acidobacteriota bacterium]MCW5950236.1 hypothetical protein [Pyrinomonadaceae bacterium]